MSFPDLILAARDHLDRRDRLLLLAFEPQSRRYIELESIPLLNPEDSTALQIVNIVRISEFIIVATQPTLSNDTNKSCYLIRLDLTLAEINRVTFQSLTALATDGEHLFISAEGDFIVLSLALTILNRVGLITHITKKNAHNIFVCDHIAYVLDNVEVPIFIFKFDCSDCHKIQLLEKHEITASFPHLDAQWIDPPHKRWYILVYNGNRFVDRQLLYFTEASHPLVETEFTIVRENPLYLSNRLGHQILASTSRVPPWIVVKEGRAQFPQTPEKLYLAQVICDGQHVRIEPGSDEYPLLDLYPFILEGEANEDPFWDSDFNKILLHQTGDLLFLIASRRNRLFIKDENVTAIVPPPTILEQVHFEEAIILVIDTHDQPPILLNQRLPTNNQVIHTFTL